MTVAERAKHLTDWIEAAHDLALSAESRHAMEHNIAEAINDAVAEKLAEFQLR